jgi:hypothetical protein
MDGAEASYKLLEPDRRPAEPNHAESARSEADTLTLSETLEGTPQSSSRPSSVDENENGSADENENGSAEPTHQQSSSSGDIDIETNERNRTSNSSDQSVMEKLDNWFVWEILGLVTSVGVLIALAIVLAKYDRKPQPNWKYMSLNSLISWLSIILSSSQDLGQLKWVLFARQLQELRV